MTSNCRPPIFKQYHHTGASGGPTRKHSLRHAKTAQALPTVQEFQGLLTQTSQLHINPGLIQSFLKLTPLLKLG